MKLVSYRMKFEAPQIDIEIPTVPFGDPINFGIMPYQEMVENTLGPDFTYNGTSLYVKPKSGKAFAIFNYTVNVFVTIKVTMRRSKIYHRIHVNGMPGLNNVYHEWEAPQDELTGFINNGRYGDDSEPPGIFSYHDASFGGLVKIPTGRSATIEAGGYKIAESGGQPFLHAKNNTMSAIFMGYA